jgi:hypothetical protein
VATTVLVTAAGGTAGGGDAPDMSGYRAAFLTVAALNLLGLYAATRVGDADAASTIPPRRASRKRATRSRREGDALPSPLPSSHQPTTEKTQERQK